MKCRPLRFRTRITLWFSAVLLAFFLILFLLITVINNSVLQQNVKSTLIGTVNNNVSEVQYSLTAAEPAEGEVYIRYGAGYLLIDRRFLRLESGVYSSLYSADGALLYGENPVGNANPPFADGRLTETEYQGIQYYIFDRMAAEGLWLRGVISEQESRGLVQNATRLILLIFPLIALVAIGGGYRIASHFAAPLVGIAKEADRISTGADLSKRLPATRDDEIGRLAQSFNSMLERLEDTFAREKRFNRDVSHELRTPLAVICAECEYALDRERSAAEYREVLQTISGKAGELSSITQALLLLSRLESGNAQVELSPMDPADAIRAAIRETAPAAQKNITLESTLEPGLTVLGNEALLTRLFANLISNAYQYGKENGRIRVTLTREDGQAVARVADDGIGVPPQERERIFDRFYRAENARRQGGSGIGLSLVREIAAAHRARVMCLGNEAGGSTFEVRLGTV